MPGALSDFLDSLMAGKQLKKAAGVGDNTATPSATTTPSTPAIDMAAEAEKAARRSRPQPKKQSQQANAYDWSGEI